MNSILHSITVFVVNLKKDKEKKEHMLKLCKKFSLNCHFIDAVYGKSLSEVEINKHYAKKMATKYSGREMSRGEIGCLLSHKYIYQKMIDEKIDQALVLEDDIEFSNDIQNVFDNVHLFPSDWELILLGHHSHLARDIETKPNIWWRHQISKKHSLIRTSETGKGTYGYMINQRGAKRLLDKLDQYYKPIDHYTGNDKDVNVYAVSPVPIRVHPEMSDDYHSMDDRKDLAKKMLLKNKTKKLSLKQLLRSLGLFYPLVYLRDSFRMILPLKKYK